MTQVLVTGGQGQLARNLKDLDSSFEQINLLYPLEHEVDITNLDQLDTYFNSNNLDYCINCAAYTQVDNAENEEEVARKVNELGVKNLATVCSMYDVVLIHISTDFVFDGKSVCAYKESDPTNPLGKYGWSKLNGEIALKNEWDKHFIIRTSWLYSEHNSNFMNTMIRLSKTREELGVVDDQIGTPTYAKDLAYVILKIIESKNKNYGLYHYSNEGVASWYDFAMAIFEETNASVKLSPIKTKDYPTPAERPTFSVLNKSKIKQTFNIEISHWRSSLKKAIINLNKTK